MVHFVGAGPGAPDLITQRGAALLQTADCIIYAGSLVNPALLGLAKADCTIYNSAEMTLEQVLAVMRKNEAAHKITVRLHTGDPCLYGAIREQMDALDADGIPYDDTPGVSSFCGAAAVSLPKVMALHRWGSISHTGWSFDWNNPSMNYLYHRTFLCPVPYVHKVGIRGKNQKFPRLRN